MRQANQIHWTLAAFGERLQRSLSAVLREIAQEGIARTQRQKAQRDALNRGASRKNTVEDFVSGAIATDGKKAPVALIVGLACKLHRVPLTGGGDDVDLQPFLAQTRESRPREFRGAAATGGGVDDGEKSVHGNSERIRNPDFRSTQSIPNLLLQGQNRCRAVQLREAFCQNIAFDFQRSRTGKVLVQQNDPVDTLVV